MSVGETEIREQDGRGQLRASHIQFVRDNRAILNDISVSIEPGVTAIIGPNGAGKSTLLSVLAGLFMPDAGEVRLGDALIGSIDRKTLALRRSYLPQNARCEWPIAVERVIALGLTPTLPLLGDLAPDSQALIEAAIEAWDLRDRRQQSALTLSGGELMRVMLARALVNAPDILIADEPIAGLDPKHALDAMERLAALGRAGRTIVVAIHDLALAARYADRVIALKEGGVFAAGAVSDVFSADVLGRLFEVDARVEPTAEGLNLRFLAANKG